MGNNNFDSEKTVKSPAENSIEPGALFPEKSCGIAADETGFIIDGTDFCGYVSNPGEKTVAVPEGIIKICEGAFRDCKNLKGIKIPESVKEIGEGAFFNCSGITEIVIPEGVDYLHDNTFNGCSGLEKVTLPKSLRKIDAWVFMDCKNLKELTIPDGVEFIDNEAFEDCEGIYVTYKGKTYDYEHIDDLCDLLGK